eukprot:TRINITY_DN95510_c0_g1_i1.p1 TRINITY_DN95510_c0_g1~~TRINITY_DN95510_c0_g1_i1.p1  ORF type:complete len:623 (+),score=189.37 TRINITY_DN95510_c0_g1_i1:85-1953(+)
MSLQVKKWDFLDDDPDLDEDAEAARREARDLREQANALSHFALRLKEPAAQQEKLCEAVAIYCRADELLKSKKRRPLDSHDRDLALQCRLNAACIAYQASSIPGGGRSGQNQAAKAEEAAGRLAAEALELDKENPHAAVLLARLAAGKRDRGGAERWLQVAMTWAQQRKDEHAQHQAMELLKQLMPDSGEESHAPSDWVRKGVELLKQGRATEAKTLLLQTVDFLDQAEHGGPIEQLTARAARALAFDTLEALSEALAASGDFAEAARNGRRAAALLLPGRAGTQAPFAEPESAKREGLLHLSLGHAAIAAGDKEAMRFFRTAAQSLQRLGDPALEGTALLELGMQLVKEYEAGDAEAAELAVPALERATECLRLARGRQERAAANKGSSSRERLAQRELRAQSALCSLHLSSNDSTAAEECLDASRHLLDTHGVEETSPSPEALEWAELCGSWAFAATKAGRLQEAEEALQRKWRLAGGKEPALDGAAEPEEALLKPLQRRSLELQREALQSLAVLRRKARDEVGVEDALSRLSRATPAAERQAAREEVQGQLLKVAPPLPEAAPEAAKEVCASRFAAMLRRHGGALLCAALALAAGLAWAPGGQNLENLIPDGNASMTLR